jgi:hypothetical protein
MRSDGLLSAKSRRGALLNGLPLASRASRTLFVVCRARRATEVALTPGHAPCLLCVARPCGTAPAGNAGQDDPRAIGVEGAYEPTGLPAQPDKSAALTVEHGHTSC